MHTQTHTHTHTHTQPLSLCFFLFFFFPPSPSHSLNHSNFDIISRFGRFPGRNPLLGRISTVEEMRYLDSVLPPIPSTPTPREQQARAEEKDYESREAALASTSRKSAVVSLPALTPSPSKSPKSVHRERKVMQKSKQALESASHPREPTNRDNIDQQGMDGDKEHKRAGPKITGQRGNAPVALPPIVA